MKKLVKEICKREGKKSQVAIGNVREVLKIVAQLIAEDSVEDIKSIIETGKTINKQSYTYEIMKGIEDATIRNLKKKKMPVDVIICKLHVEVSGLDKKSPVKIMGEKCQKAI